MALRAGDLQNSIAVDELRLRPIGIIHTPFIDRTYTPHQGSLDASQAEGLIVLSPKKNLEQALCDLEGFEKIWIISWFHCNRHWKPMVLPPRPSSGKKRGVLATRSPHRPNPIGLTAADLLEVKGRRLRVRGIDLLDGTPVLDIKPYIPYADAFPHARRGWTDEIAAVDGKAVPFAVHWSAEAQAQAEFLKAFGIDIAALARGVLENDPTPHPYRRISRDRHGRLRLAIKSWRVDFVVEGNVVQITGLRSGYSAEAMAGARAGKVLHQQAAHISFHQRWPQ